MIALSEEKARSHGLFIIVLLYLLFLLPGTGSLPLFDRDEPRFSGATIEMIERGDYLVPYFNDTFRFDKPPLTYWWMSIHYHLFGVHEFAARLHAVLASLVCGLSIYGFGRQFFSARTGLLAALGFLTTFQALIHGRLALADMPLIACLVLSHWALWNLVKPTSTQSLQKFGKWFWLFWVSASLGFLAKGPLSIGVPLLSLLLYRFVFYRRSVSVFQIQPFWGTVVFLIPLALWGIPALLATNGAYWEVGIGKHVIERGLDAFNDRKSFPLFYFFTVGISLFPWFALFWVWQRRVRRDWDPLNAFLVSWLIAPFLIFSFYATQLPHYILPGFPAFFLLLFRRPCLPLRNHLRTRFHRLFEKISAALFGGIIILVLISRLDRYAPLLALGIIAISLAFLSLLWLVRANRSFSHFLLVGCVVGLALSTLGHGLRQNHATIRLAQLLDFQPGLRQIGLGLGYGFTEPSLVFYTGHFWLAASSGDSIQQLMAEEDVQIVVTLVQDYPLEALLLAAWSGQAPESKRHHTPPDFLPPGQIFRVSGINPARFSWATVEIWRPSPQVPGPVVP
ncbi:MAG: ArnT family glycosyltransferase [Puniceicoccaceae bacterium]